MASLAGQDKLVLFVRHGRMHIHIHKNIQTYTYLLTCIHVCIFKKRDTMHVCMDA